MAASSDFECYLCGSHNEPDASFCIRCNGQLLHLPGVEEPEATTSTPVADIAPTVANTGVTEDDRDELLGEAKPAKKRRRVGRTVGSVQDQRLSDALGLTEDAPDQEDEGLFVETVVTSIPRATQSSEIPLLGTRPGVIPQSAMSSRETGKKTYALLAFLLAFTGWFGYNTITRDRTPQPESIAFVSTTTVPATTTTTTEKAVRQWQQSEVQGHYNSVFVNIDFYDCDVPIEKGKKTRKPLATSTGVIINTNNVLVSAAPSGADAVDIRSRTGQRRVAMIDRTTNGLTVVSSIRQSTRNLGLSEDISDAPKFFVSYDPETNIVITETASNTDASSELLVTGTGAAHSVRLDGRTYSANELFDIDIRYEVDPEAAAPKSDACSTAAVLRRVLPEGTELPEDSTTTSPDGVDDAVNDEE